MNSALQCLSNCEELTKYFLFKHVFEELNKSNKYGSNGNVAIAYYELVKELWLGASKYLCPSDFRQIFVRFVRQFQGFSQHDSQEMLAFMLDTLHEDLNRVKDKPYIELSEKHDAEGDVLASARWWKNHLTRENSIIVDLFHGQYKSVITCPECNKISITYDPFMYLGLPIPTSQSKIKFKFFPYGSYKIIEYDFPINEHSTIKEMKQLVQGTRNISNPEKLEAVFIKDKLVKKVIHDEDRIISYLKSDLEVVIYEKAHIASDYISFYIFPSELVEENRYFILKKTTLRILTYPTLFTLYKKDTIKDLYIEVLKFYSKILYDLDISKEDKFDKYLKDDNFSLHLINNIPEASGFFSSKPSCEFCGNKCESCHVPLSRELLQVFLIKMKYPRPLLLYLELKKFKQNVKIFENNDTSNTDTYKQAVVKQKKVDIYDCINLFRTEEKLEKENAWYCSNCKKHQEALKKLDIYRAPNILIVQFKRFKIKSNSSMMGFLSNRKNDSIIDYPVEKLDLTNFIASDVKEDAVYDLFAISQHYGGISSGHYTALCKNFDNWYEFDDDRVSKATPEDIVTSSAYLLFYKKRDMNKK
jgi:ubiquitin C-terminal hydrolase